MIARSLICLLVISWAFVGSASTNINFFTKGNVVNGSETAKQELDALLSSMMPFAQMMLDKAGTFYPYGGIINTSGKPEAHGAYNGEEHPKPQELIDILMAGFRQGTKEKKFRAVGMCVDVRTIPPNSTEKTDAIAAMMEHESGIAVTVFLPYKREASGKYVYGQMFARNNEPKIFTSAKSDSSDGEKK